MAIDSEGKRRSTLDVKAFARILPVPSGTIGAAARAHLFIYSGIAISGAPAPTTTVLDFERKHRGWWRGAWRGGI